MIARVLVHNSHGIPSRAGHQKSMDHRLVTFYRESARGAFLFFGFCLFSSPVRIFWFRCVRRLPARLACQRSLWVPYHLRYDLFCSEMLPLAACHDSGAHQDPTTARRRWCTALRSLNPPRARPWRRGRAASVRSIRSLHRGKGGVRHRFEGDSRLWGLLVYQCMCFDHNACCCDLV